MSEKKKGLYERELGYIAHQREMLEKGRAICAIVDDVEAKFPDLYLSSSAGYNVSVSFNLNAVSDIVPVLRYLSQVHNMRHKGIKKESTSLSWTFRRKGDDPLHSKMLTVNAYFKNDGQCKQVQVGEKLVPVYEIRCGAGLEKVEDLVDDTLNEGQEEV